MQAVFNELCNMLDPGKPAFVPKKGKPNVIMFVGLQGERLVESCSSVLPLRCISLVLVFKYGRVCRVLSVFGSKLDVYLFDQS